MEITILGTGTSQGVPVIGCDCAVCQSDDHRDKRLRTAALVCCDGIHVAIDAGPDFRQQMLQAGLNRLDAIVLTHEHNDHIIGLDDVRPFNFRQGKKMPVFAGERVQEQLTERFRYAFQPQPYPGAPGFELHPVEKDKPFSVEGIQVIPIEVMHGNLPIFGFRFFDFTYITDARTIEPKELEKARNSRILVLNALHHTPHHSHLNLTQALHLIEELKPEQAFLIHMSHYMGLHREVEKRLPPNVRMAYDGLKIQL